MVLFLDFKRRISSVRSNKSVHPGFKVETHHKVFRSLKLAVSRFPETFAEKGHMSPVT